MNTTLLHSWHEAAGAKFAPFAGYDMPISYPMGAVEEHRLCRRSVGLFDIDHMGQFVLQGRGATDALSGLVTAKIDDMQAKEARYAMLLNEKGGVIDDLFLYRLGEEDWFIVVNAGNRAEDFAWFSAHLQKLPGFSALTFKDISDETYMIAVQGPKAVELLDKSCDGAPLVSTMQRATMEFCTIFGIDCKVGRTGYTGEDGVEIYCNIKDVEKLWTSFLNKAKDLGIEAGPIGLAARDSLRFEAGMPLHGHEISQSILPMEALLSWACDFDKEFIGKAALLKAKEAGLTRKLCTLNITGGVPREGYRVLDADGKPLGDGTTSGLCVCGMFCPTVGTYSANAFVPPEYAKVGTQLKVEIRGAGKDAVVAKRPLYLPVYRK
ncbi:MAG: glycine cleavage system aminomethyltransferase GcvT [Spirochaetaceae bacterium]|jgi:glycine cleavage system T protein|nr:glycine cleavage system aminomethyltransferase GcvT [Spirochaetaceae bacterium]